MFDLGESSCDGLLDFGLRDLDRDDDLVLCREFFLGVGDLDRELEHESREENDSDLILRERLWCRLGETLLDICRFFADFEFVFLCFSDLRSVAAEEPAFWGSFELLDVVVLFSDGVAAFFSRVCDVVAFFPSGVFLRESCSVAAEDLCLRLS